MSQGNAIRLLLVEDDLPLVELLTWHFARHQIEVTATPNGGEALQLATDEMPDAVLLDWTIEGLCGLEVCRRLRSAVRTASLPIVMITARDDAHDRAAAFASGASDFVAKPFSPFHLVARVQALLQSDRPSLQA